MMWFSSLKSTEWPWVAVAGRSGRNRWKGRRTELENAGWVSSWLTVLLGMNTCVVLSLFLLFCLRMLCRSRYVLRLLYECVPLSALGVPILRCRQMLPNACKQCNRPISQWYLNRDRGDISDQLKRSQWEALNSWRLRSHAGRTLLNSGSVIYPLP